MSAQLSSCFRTLLVIARCSVLLPPPKILGCSLLLLLLLLLSSLSLSLLLRGGVRIGRLGSVAAFRRRFRSRCRLLVAFIPLVGRPLLAPATNRIVSLAWYFPPYRRPCVHDDDETSRNRVFGSTCASNRHARIRADLGWEGLRFLSGNELGFRFGELCKRKIVNYLELFNGCYICL